MYAFVEVPMYELNIVVVQVWEFPHAYLDSFIEIDRVISENDGCKSPLKIIHLS